MTSWSHGLPHRPGERDRLAAARDVAIIAVCIAILAFGLLAFLGAPHEPPPPRARQPAALTL
jgi:hypothetical protein